MYIILLYYYDTLAFIINDPIGVKFGTVINLTCPRCISPVPGISINRLLLLFVSMDKFGISILKEPKRKINFVKFSFSFKRWLSKCCIC